METRAVKIFITEGPRDNKYLNSMLKNFFVGKEDAKIINLPARQNLYMLWNLLSKDEFETDFIELLRENVPKAKNILQGVTRQNIDEIYLFFDYDAHQNNLPKFIADPGKVLKEMLKTFDNETENGKLYISYPMVEALRDFIDDSCVAHFSCVVNKDEFINYKSNTGEKNPNVYVSSYSRDTWIKILQIFYWRLACLFDNDNLDELSYRKMVTPKSIFEVQTKKYACDGKIFVLSSYPEFLLDYFNSSFWNENIKQVRCEVPKCNENNE